MEDERIIELYFSRDERALKETADKYGSYLMTIANNILNQLEEAEECVNDTYLRAWNSIPPTRPNRFNVFLAGIVRNLAIDRYRKKRTVKNGGGQVALCLDELSECIGERDVDIDDANELKNALNGFLKGIKTRQKDIFLLRYYYLLPIEDVAKRCKCSKASEKMSLHRTRKELRNYLEKEGISI